MSNTIVLKKGLDVPVSGSAALLVSKSMTPQTVAILPDVKGLLPRLLVKEGDRVLCGSPVIADKKNPDILLTSPVSGTVKEVVRGEKRKLLEVVVEADYKSTGSIGSDCKSSPTDSQRTIYRKNLGL